MTPVDLAVIGGGPGGYAAAFRAADLGLSVALIERRGRLGGVCLNTGCIPSKTLLHAAALIEDAEAWRGRGVDFGAPRIDLDALRAWKEDGVARLAAGLARLAEQRRVAVREGRARFVSAHTLRIDGGDGGGETLRFAQAVIAAGSRPARLPELPDDPRVLDSSGALALEAAPERLLVVGGGVLGLELGTVYRALGARVTVVELADRLLGEADADVLRAWRKVNEPRFAALHTGTKVAAAAADEAGISVALEGAERRWEERFDAVLAATGRVADTAELGLAAAGVAADARGEIPVNHQLRTNVPHLFAVGDVTGAPMLAHRAAHQGRIAAEVAAGGASAYDVRAMPAVAYTDPEAAWVGLTERAARAAGTPVERAVFPWAASGRAVGVGRVEGLSKLLLDPDTRRVVGAAAVGPHAGELIAAAALAIETGCEAEDLAGTVHPHPTFAETLARAAEVALGSSTELPPRRAKPG